MVAAVCATGVVSGAGTVVSTGAATADAEGDGVELEALSPPENTIAATTAARTPPAITAGVHRPAPRDSTLIEDSKGPGGMCPASGYEIGKSASLTQLVTQLPHLRKYRLDHSG